MLQQQLLVSPVLVKGMVLLHTSAEVGGRAWAEALGSEAVTGTSGGAPGGPSQAPPAALEQLAAWVEGDGTTLRALAAQVTPEGAAARLASTPWGEEYRRKDSHALGDDLNSADLSATHLPDYLLRPLMERCAVCAVGWVGLRAGGVCRRSQMLMSFVHLRLQQLPVSSLVPWSLAQRLLAWCCGV